MRVGGQTLARVTTLINFHPRLTGPLNVPSQPFHICFCPREVVLFLVSIHLLCNSEQTKKQSCFRLKNYRKEAGKQSSTFLKRVKQQHALNKSKALNMTLYPCNNIQMIFQGFQSR